jgi:LacI family transcriptional regulator
MKRITMADLAKRLGIARSSVSRALRNDPQISAAVRQRVQALARALGYEREAAFEVLAQHRKGSHSGERRMTVGFLAGNDIHTAANLVGARAKADELGYGVDLFRLADYSASALQRMLLNRGIRGIILPILNDHQPLPDLDWNRFTAVCCSVDAHHPPFHSVRVNVVSKVSMAWERMTRLGHRRIAIAIAHSDSGPNELDMRRAGVALYHLRQQAGEFLLWDRPFAESASLRSWLEQHQPDAVIVGNHSLLPPLDAHAAALGRPVSHCCLLPSPGRPHLDSQPRVIGATALSILHQQIVENQHGFPPNPFTGAGQNIANEG